METLFKKRYYSNLQKTSQNGALVNVNADEIVSVVEDYLQHPYKYNQQAIKAMQWSRQFTMEKFEEEIGRLLLP